MDISNFHFNGRYTLRKMGMDWFIYDRETTAIVEDTREHTFPKAQTKLILFKQELNDKI